MKQRKTALITGASGGLGVHFANRLAKSRYNLLLVARDEEKLHNIKRLLESVYSVKVDTFVQDLSQPDAAEAIRAFTTEQKLQIDVLINNAGFGDFGTFADCDWKKQEEMIQVNCTALLQLTKCFLKPMIRRRSGKILNVASMAAFQPGPLMSVYYATKAFVLSFTEALSVELRGTGVTVTALCPGPTQTGFEERASLGDSGLFRNLSVASAKDVAVYGLWKMKLGKTIAIPGCKNKLIVLASKWMPRKLVRTIVYEIQK